MADKTHSLYHYGILGMKWGKRRNPRVNSEDHTKTKGLKSKKPRELSNDEIKALTERLRLEKNLREIKSHDQTKGLEFVKTVTSVGTTVAALYALSTTPMGEAVKRAIIKKMGKSE